MSKDGQRRLYKEKRKKERYSIYNLQNIPPAAHVSRVGLPAGTVSFVSSEKHEVCYSPNFHTPGHPRINTTYRPTQCFRKFNIKRGQPAHHSLKH